MGFCKNVVPIIMLPILFLYGCAITRLQSRDEIETNLKKNDVGLVVFSVNKIDGYYLDMNLENISNRIFSTEMLLTPDIHFGINSTNFVYALQPGTYVCNYIRVRYRYLNSYSSQPVFIKETYITVKQGEVTYLGDLHIDVEWRFLVPLRYEFMSSNNIDEIRKIYAGVNVNENIVDLSQR